MAPWWVIKIPTYANRFPKGSVDFKLALICISMMHSLSYCYRDNSLSLPRTNGTYFSRVDCMLKYLWSQIPLSQAPCKKVMQETSSYKILNRVKKARGCA